MSENKGYQILGMLLRKKIPLLNAHILHLMFTMAGTIDSGRDTNGVQNIPAFRDILCDLELWHEAPAELEKLLLEHLLELVSDPQKNIGNIRLMREFALVEKLLNILKKSDCRNSNTTLLLEIMRGLLCTNPRVSDVLCFALFTTATLSFPTVEKKMKINEGVMAEQSQENVQSNKVILRNQCLKLFFSLLHTGDDDIHINYCEDVVQVVGFDWILLFLHADLHRSTVIWGMRILMTLLSLPTLMQKFRTGICNGHWLIKSENVLHNKMMEALGSDAPQNSKVSRKHTIRSEIFKVPGFQHLNWLLVEHIEVPEVLLSYMIQTESVLSKSN